MAHVDNKTETAKNELSYRIITKDESMLIYGIAILIMVFHHVFKNADPTIESPLLVHSAWNGKICVAFYAFISGYGIERKHGKKSMQAQYKAIISCIVKVMYKYWIVFLVFFPFILYFSKASISVKVFLLNLCGIRFDYNGAWWYVKQYVLMLLCYPVLCQVIKRINRKRIAFLFYIFLIVLFWGYYSKIIILYGVAESVFITYLLVFTEGVLYGGGVLKYPAMLDCKWISFFMLSICIGLRFMLADSAAYCLIDIVIIPYVIICTCNIINCAVAKKTLFFLGVLSPYIWLSHCFYILLARKMFYGYRFENIYILIMVMGTSIVTGSALVCGENWLTGILKKYKSIKQKICNERQNDVE